MTFFYLLRLRNWPQEWIILGIIFKTTSFTKQILPLFFSSYSTNWSFINCFFQKGRKIHPNDEELGAVLFSRKVPMVPTLAKAYTSAKGLDAIARHGVKNICLGFGDLYKLVFATSTGWGSIPMYTIDACIYRWALFHFFDFPGSVNELK